MRPTCLIFILVLVATALSVAPAVSQGWTGPYAGVHSGYRLGTLDISNAGYPFPGAGGGTGATPARTETFLARGAIAGTHFGFNIALAGPWLIGVETDVSLGEGHDRRRSPFAATYFTPQNEAFITTLQDRTARFTTTWQGSTRLRMGIALGPLLFYVTARTAYQRAKWTETSSVTGGTTDSVGKSMTLVGWAAGSGIEAFVAPNFILRTEYLYEDFGTVSVPLAFSNETAKADITVQKIRAGLSFKF